MINSLGGRSVMTAIAVTLGTVIGAQAPARADRFAMDYTCEVPLLGDRSVQFDGALTAIPSRLAAGTPVRVLLRISHLSLRPPVAVTSWSAVAEVAVSGAQTREFRLAGSGGPVRAYDSVTGELTGRWVPRVPGIDQLRLGRVTLKVSTSSFGDVMVPCAPNEPRPVAETLTVFAR